MRKNSNRITDLLQIIDNNDNTDTKIVITDHKINNTKQKPKQNNYWELSKIKSNVYEFLMSNNDDSNISNVKMYVIENDTYDDVVYYSIITVAFNKELQKTISNYGIGTEETILNNFNINLEEVRQQAIEKAIDDLDDSMIEDIAKEHELFSADVANYLTENINLVKSACVSKKSLHDVLYELLMNMNQPEDYDEDDN